MICATHNNIYISYFHCLLRNWNLSLSIEYILLTTLISDLLYHRIQLSYRICVMAFSIYRYINFIFSFVNTFVYKCGHRNVLSKRQVWMSIFHNKKLILDYYFCLKSGPVFLFQIFIIAPPPPPPPKGYKIVSLIIN